MQETRYRFNLEGVTKEELVGYMLYKMKEILGRIPVDVHQVYNVQEIHTIADWLLNGKKQSLLIMGRTGSGKTILAEVLYWTLKVKCPTPNLHSMDWVRKMLKINQELPECCGEDRMLILDDVGSEPAEEMIYGSRTQIFNEILYSRYRRRQPMIITTNLTWENSRSLSAILSPYRSWRSWLFRLVVITKGCLFS